MKVLVYSLRDMEKPCYIGLAEKLGIDIEFTTENPTVETASLAAGFEAVSVITTPITADVIQAFYDQGVRFISTRNIGYDHIDVEAAKRIGMSIGNSSYAPNSVAEYTVMLMLMCKRKATIITDAFKKQDYTLDGKMGSLMSNATVGVIGTGRIGFEVIKLISGFGCKIVAYDPYPNEAVKDYAEYVDLDTLYERSDIITLHAPSTSQNYHLINEDALSKMKNGVVIINAARGSLIDSDALVAALQNGKVAGAGLDVVEGEGPIYFKNFEGQPVPLESIEKLSQFPNVIMTPHTAFYTQNAVVEMVQNSIASCAAYLKREDNPWKIV